MNKKLKIIAFAAAAALLTGCFKKVSLDTTYVLKPLVQASAGDVNQPLEGVRAYAFEADSTLWTVASYQDALDGVLTSKTTPGQKITTPLATAEPYEREGALGWLQMRFSSPSLMILIVDTQNRLYAYTQQTFVENLPTLYVTILFKPWKEGRSYKDAIWSFYNQFYIPPKTLKCFVAPTQQALENGPETEISSLKAYAYAADTTAWYLASYQDAVDGKITSKTDPKQTRTNPNFAAFKEADSGLYGMSVTATPLMVVVVDRDNKMYAYCKKEVDLSGEPQTFPIVFRSWKKSYLYVEQGWRVVDEQFLPKDQTPAVPALKR